MEDGDSVIEHLNAFDTLVSQLISINIMIVEEDKCISLGPIGEKGLRILHGKGMVEGMSNCTLDFDFCEHLIYGKHNRVRFPSGAT